MAKGPVKTLFKDAVVPKSSESDSDHKGVQYVDGDFTIPLVIGVGMGSEPADLFPFLKDLG